MGPDLVRGVPGPCEVTDPLMPCHQRWTLGFQPWDFDMRSILTMMMPLPSPKLKIQSDDEAVSTILLQHPQKDFVSAQPLFMTP